MNSLELKLDNCYGINSLNAIFDFTKSHSNVIYASNGSMKTSLTNTFKKIALKQSPEEKIHGKISNCRIEQDSIAIDTNTIFVIEPFDEVYQAKNISTLLVNQEMKAEYDTIFENIIETKNKLYTSFNKLSKIKKDDIETNILKDFNSDNIFNFFNSIFSELDNAEDFSKLQYSIIFDQKVVEILNQENVSSNLKTYIDKYNQLISTIQYYKKGGFNPIKADNVAKTLEKEKYFEAENSIVLNGQDHPIKDSKQFIKKLEEDKLKILDDAELKKIGDLISNGVASVKAFQEVFESHPEIAFELTNIDNFKKKIWLSYFKKNKNQIEECLALYNNGKLKMEEIEKKAKIEETRWFEVKEIFKQRFDVPFDIEIKDQKNTILGTINPNLVFCFEDKHTGNKKEFSREGIQGLKILSQGERRALYLLYVIFEVQSRRLNSTETLFIIDDIADSFDYKNKYAIIEYLKEMNDEPFFNLLILTHNFDFFRTIQTRIIGKQRWDNSYIAIKDEHSIELIKSGSKSTTNPFEYWRCNLHSNNTMLISSIPFLRNIIEFKEGYSHQDYIFLTSLLHIKSNPDSYTITLGQLENLFKKYLSNVDFKLGTRSTDKVVDLIFTNADTIMANTRKETAEIELKVALSIAIRLKAEIFMWRKINNQSQINGNQTGILYDRYKNEYSGISNEKDNIKLLSSVNLMTPENIHLNSFMYEPILDMSNHHLFDLYHRIKSL